MPAAPLEGLRSIRGQPHATALLARAAASGRLANAYLFEGPPGVGKERAARALAQVTVCSSKRPDGDACGACPECRHVANNSHVDVITLAREVDPLSQKDHSKSDIKSEIAAEKVRVLISERLAYHSHQGTRWVIVRNADELSGVAANAILKTLEEPPSQTHFAVITSRPHLLLTTIRSRCQRVRFAPLSEAIVTDLLTERGIERATAEDAARLSEGSMTRALECADPEILASRRSWVERVIKALRAGKTGAYVDVAEALKDLARSDEVEATAVLGLVERHFRDEAVRYASENPRRAATCAARSDLVRQTVDSLDANLNLQIAVENMLVRLREVRA